MIFDRAAVKRNEHILAGASFGQLEIWEDREPAVESLRAFVGKEPAAFPRMSAGENIALLWLKEAGSVILLNLAECDNAGVLSYNGCKTDISMKGLEMAVVSLEVLA